MENNKKERRRFNILSIKTFIFLIFIILQKKINTFNISITIIGKGNQQILDNSFPKPSEISINFLSSSFFSKISSELGDETSIDELIISIKFLMMIIFMS